MQGETHEIAALAAAVYSVPVIIGSNPSILSDTTILTTTSVFLLSALIGGLLPDADMPGSTIGYKLLPLTWPVYLFRGLLRLMARFIPKLKNVVKTLGHRGVSHSPLIWIVTLSLIYFMIPFPYSSFTRIIVKGLTIGILSHLILYFFSGGIPLLIPFSLKRYKPGIIHIKTGGYMEKAIGCIKILALCLALLKFVGF